MDSNKVILVYCACLNKKGKLFDPLSCTKIKKERRLFIRKNKFKYGKVQRQDGKVRQKFLRIYDKFEKRKLCKFFCKRLDKIGEYFSRKNDKSLKLENILSYFC